MFLNFLITDMARTRGGAGDRTWPELQNSHFSQQPKFFFYNGSENERRGGVRVHIKHYCQLIQTAN